MAMSYAWSFITIPDNAHWLQKPICGTIMAFVRPPFDFTFRSD